MKKIFEIIMGVFIYFVSSVSVIAADKFDILPDLPEPLATAQAASVSSSANSSAITAGQTIGQEPNFLSVLFSLIFVVLLIYATGIIYTRLNKMGINTFKKQMGDSKSSKVTVISTTPLGGNKMLHIVELDGKRMLLGASQGSIQLLKDLGTYPPCEINTAEFSKIEIPNIRIPKIEIPKIEFPNIGFTKTFNNSESNIDDNIKTTSEKEGNEIIEDNISNTDNNDTFEISDIYEESSDGIIDKLFKTTSENENKEQNNIQSDDEHKVNPDEYALYKKYL